MDEVFELIDVSYWPYFLLDTGVWVLLLLIVSTVSKAGAPRG
jgi:hypothetical protein